jgi:hypothetical protein
MHLRVFKRVLKSLSLAKESMALFRLGGSDIFPTTFFTFPRSEIGADAPDKRSGEAPGCGIVQPPPTGFIS